MNLPYVKHNERVVTFASGLVVLEFPTANWEKMGRPAWMHARYIPSGDYEDETVPLQRWEADRLPAES